MTSAQTANHFHHDFTLIRAQHIASLNIDVEHYQHEATGAAHYHIVSDNPENVFLVALRTVPEDSKGVAHILEHTALCGSKNYPVRDPFFMMLRRSLNTFMNAFTSSDWTAYPFASQNRKDFSNLLSVYLDAVFFSRLDPLDFAQEGHRIEFCEPENSDSELIYKGIVFNEMKGAMSSANSVLWHSLCEHLFPSNTYGHNSGGDPEQITNLSYDQLIQFYRSHYHPSNAIFMTFGNIPAVEHQAEFVDKVLSQFERLDHRIEVHPEQRLNQAVHAKGVYAYDEPGAGKQKTHIVVAWLLGESCKLKELLEAQLLASVLIDNSASPLMHALETTELGLSPSPLCGLEDSMREMVFVCGVEGSDSEHTESVEQLIFSTIEKVVSEGIEHENLEAVLHQLELHQREVSGDGMPYGLQLILQGLSCATHYHDPIAVLDLEPVIDELREAIKSPQYLPELARRMLLENQHRVTYTLSPDATLSQRRISAEKDKLEAIKQGLSDQEKQRVIQQSLELKARQEQVDDASLLPKVELSDIPASLPELQSAQFVEGKTKLCSYAQGTNGLVYQQLVCPLPQLSTESIKRLPYYTNILTDLGIGEHDYLKTQQHQACTVGSINAFSSMRGSLNDTQDISAYFVLSSKALAINGRSQTELMHDTLDKVRFDEHGRIRELISQQRSRRESSLSGNGHGLALAAACAGMSPLAELNHELSGLLGIQNIRQLDKALDEEPKLQRFADELAEIHQAISGSRFQSVIIAEANSLETLTPMVRQRLSGRHALDSTAKLELPFTPRKANELWLGNTQVNFCAMAFPTVPTGHEDAPALSVLGGFLRNGFLHRSIREQGGAYGGGASQDSSIGAFRFYSYRDPRLDETLADFKASIDWMLNTTHSDQALEESILGIMGSVDKPSSPAGEAKQHFHNYLFGRSHATREAFRQGILEVTLADLKRVTERYLKEELASTAVLAPASLRTSDPEIASRLNLSLIEL